MYENTAMKVSSSSSASIHSTTPSRMRSDHLALPERMSSTCLCVSMVLPWRTTSIGLLSLPSSQLMMISFMLSSNLMLTSCDSSPERLLWRISSTSSLGLSCRPIRSPLTYILVSFVYCSPTSLTPRSLSSQMTSFSSVPSDTSTMSAQFLTRPQF